MKQILKGVGASRGVARGEVKIVCGVEDVTKFKDGYVLVTKITDPTMVSMMARAAAIVCDIGSLTSHPSIVSREMGIPCVVNTRQGTTILKDGVVVEVNGETGEIFLVDSQTNTLKEVNNEVEMFLQSFVSSVTAMDFSTFNDTISWDRYDPLVANNWTKRILNMVDDCEQMGLEPLEVAKLFPSTSELRGTMFFELWLTKFAKVSKEQRLKIFDFFSQALKALCLEDPYGQSKNLIHSGEKIENLVSKTSLASPEIARKLGRLVSACYHLGHAFYSDMHPTVVYDNYGPYHLANGQMIVVKDFGNFVTSLWRESQNFTFNHIQIVAVYRGVGMAVDSVSHVQYVGDPIAGLEKFVVLVDGKEVSADRLVELSEVIENVAIASFTRFKALDFENKKKLYLFQKAYTYKKLYDKLGQNWRPSQEILDEAKGKPLYQPNWPEDKKLVKEVVEEILDPRVDRKQ